MFTAQKLDAAYIAQTLSDRVISSERKQKALGLCARLKIEPDAVVTRLSESQQQQWKAV